MKYDHVTRRVSEADIPTSDICFVMVFCIAVVVRWEFANWVIRSGSFDSLAVMSLVRKVFSKQSPDLGLMHMKHLGSRFEAVHASMVSG